MVKPGQRHQGISGWVTGPDGVRRNVTSSKGWTERTGLDVLRSGGYGRSSLLRWLVLQQDWVQEAIVLLRLANGFSERISFTYQRLKTWRPMGVRGSNGGIN
jgi:hypothetical protein